MKTVRASKANSLSDKDIEPVTIQIAECLPDFDGPGDATWHYHRQAQELEQALYAALPGGTYDHLLVRMLQRTASTLTVSWKERE